MAFSFSPRDLYVAPPDFAGARLQGMQEGEAAKQIRSLSDLRDLARGPGTDITTAPGRDAFRAAAYKADPITASKFEPVLAQLDDNARVAAAKQREEAGRAYLRILNAPVDQRGKLWQAASGNPALGKTFSGQYSPDAMKGLEGEFLDFDRAYSLYAARDTKAQGLTALGLGGGAPGAAPQQQPGQPPAGGYRARLRGFEAGGDPSAKNPQSSATGLYQPITSTWADMGMGDADRADPKAQEEFLSRFLASNNAELKRFLRRDATDAEQYAAHRFGAGNAKRLLLASPDLSIEKVIGSKAADVNEDLWIHADGAPATRETRVRPMTAGEVRGMTKSRMGEGTTWNLPPAPGESNDPVNTGPFAGLPEGPPGAAPAAAPGAPAAQDQSIEAVFARMPEWQQAAIVSSADPEAAFYKYAEDAAKNPGWQRVIVNGKEILRNANGDEKPVPGDRQEKTASLAKLLYPNGTIKTFNGASQQDQIDAALAEGAQVVPEVYGTPANVPNTKEAIEAATVLRTELTRVTKDIRDVQTAYKKVASAADKPSTQSGASDMALIFAFMKILDPTSAVREQEYANAENSGSVPDSVRNAYNKALSGNFLTEAQRQDFKAQAYQAYLPYQERYAQDALYYAALATRNSLRPEDVIIPFDVIPEPKISKAPITGAVGAGDPNAATAIEEQWGGGLVGAPPMY